MPFALHHLGPRSAWLLLGASSCLAVGCAEDSDATPPTPPLQSNNDAQCPPGSIDGPLGDCMPVGIQGCAEMFLGSDRLCRPSLAACPPGTIPRFEEGCAPVGISRCAEVFLEGDGLCHPAMEKCPAGTMALPQEGCVSIDGPEGCGEGPFGHIPDDPLNTYVDPSQADGAGDGSLAHPFATLGEALSRVLRGGRVVLAAGTYNEAALVRKPMEIVGRCASMVRLRGTITWRDYPPATVVVDSAPSVRLAGLRLEGPGIGVVAHHAPELKIERLHVADASYLGILTSGAGTSASISHTRIERTRGIGRPGCGLQAQLESRASLEASALLANQGCGALAVADASLSISGSLVEDTRFGGTDEFAIGVGQFEKSTVELVDSALVKNHTSAVLASGAGASATLRGVLVERTVAGRLFTSPGDGVHVENGARASVESSVISDNSFAGVAVYYRDAEANISGSLIRRTLSSEHEHGHGAGIAMIDGARVKLTSSAVVDCAQTGIVVAADSTLEAHGNLIQGNGMMRSYSFGGLSVDRSVATLSSSAVVANGLAGIAGIGTWAQLDLTNNLVTAAVPGLNGQLGVGLFTKAQGRVTSRSNAWTDHHEFAVGAFPTLEKADAIALEMSGDLIQNTMSGVANDLSGIGLFTWYTKLTMDSSVLRDNRAMAIALSLTTAEISRTAVRGVHGGKALFTGEGAVDIGDGIVIGASESANLREVEVTGCSRSGILYLDSLGSLAQTRSHNNGFGLVIQGSLGPTLGDGNEFSGNREGDQVMDKELAVPLDRPGLP